MPKVSVDLIADVLQNNEIEPDVITKLIKEIEQQAEIAAEEEKASREPPVKKQFVIVVSDPRGVMPEEDFVGWIAQIPESDSPATTMERIERAAFEFNISKKGRKHPAKTVGEACEAVGAKFFKEQAISIKNKIPVTVLKTDNQLPEIEDDFEGATSV